MQYVVLSMGKNVSCSQIESAKYVRSVYLLHANVYSCGTLYIPLTLMHNLQMTRKVCRWIIVLKHQCLEKMSRVWRTTSSTYTLSTYSSFGFHQMAGILKLPKNRACYLAS